MLENPQLRWAFIRKVYVILLLQLLLMVAVAAVVVTKHPVNLLLLGLFTITISFTLGLGACKVILEATILTAVVVVSLTVNTFWAAQRGHDFNFLGPFLFAATLVLMVFGLIQSSVMIYGCLAAIIFSGYIIYDTNNLIKRFTYDDYIWASVSHYLDIINLFTALLTILGAAE
ncbi:hypothetical protein MKX01_009863 [Papaver californicum]|nr:hypothetical protein MKX01_009863 [Papaver californicum]